MVNTSGVVVLTVVLAALFVDAHPPFPGFMPEFGSFAVESDSIVEGYFAKKPEVNCTVTCNGEEFDPRTEEKSTCWGTTKFFCHATFKNFSVCGGFKCEGHWGKFDTLGFCEGAGKHFSVMKISSSDKPPLKILSGAGCLGSGGMKFNKTGGPKSMAPLRQLQESTTDYESWSFLEMFARLFEDSDMLQMTVGEGEIVAEGRCEGRSFKGKKVLLPPPDREEEADVKMDCFEDMEGMVADAMGPLLEDAAHGMGGLPLSTLHVPLEPPPPPHGCPHKGMPHSQHMTHQHDQHDDDGVWGRDHMDRAGPPHPKCTVTCDGKPAMFFGAFPCWGKFVANCTLPPPPNGTEMIGRMESDVRGVGRRLGAGDLAGMPLMEHVLKLMPWSSQPKDASSVESLPLMKADSAGDNMEDSMAMHMREAEGEGMPMMDRMSMMAAEPGVVGDGELYASGPTITVSCTGFFSGRWFGSLCGGLTGEVVSFKHVTKYDYCSGKHGMMPIRGPKPGPGFVSFCMGKHLFAVEKGE